MKIITSETKTRYAIYNAHVKMYKSSIYAVQLQFFCLKIC